MSDVRDRGMEEAVEALRRRGASVEVAPRGRSKNWLRVHFPDHEPVAVYVKTRAAGDWQTDTRLGDPNPRNGQRREFWLFLDLLRTPTRFYIAPASWVEKDIYDRHQEYLRRHGGHRARTPSSTHHRITEDRIKEWLDRWDLLDG